MKKKIAWALLACVVVGALAFGATAALAKPPSSEPGCYCPDVWDPVLCSDGNVYSNFCYAGCAGATGCSRTGDI